MCLLLVHILQFSTHRSCPETSPNVETQDPRGSTGDVIETIFTINQQLPRPVWPLHEETCNLAAGYHVTGSLVRTAEAHRVSVFLAKLSMVPRKVTM